MAASYEINKISTLYINSVCRKCISFWGENRQNCYHVNNGHQYNVDILTSLSGCSSHSNGGGDSIVANASKACSTSPAIIAPTRYPLTVLLLECKFSRYTSW